MAILARFCEQRLAWNIRPSCCASIYRDDYSPPWFVYINFRLEKKIFRVENLKLLGSGMASHKCILNAESRTIATGILQQLIILSCHSMKKLWKRCKKNAMEIRIMPSAHRCVDPLKCIMQNWRLSRFVCGSGIFCLRAICTQKCHSVSKASQINAIILIEMSKIIS